MCDLGTESQKSFIDAPCSWYWGLLSSTLDNLLRVPEGTTYSLVVIIGVIVEIAFKGVLLMKQLAKCRSVDPTFVVAAPLELLTGITCNSCSVTSSVVAGIAEMSASDPVTYGSILSVIGD
ncbi:hypothetical protein HanRHA438_Chr15g0712571 [Helianthus annuus]|nr:hypothetical protein HanRHA438_Chr15g0712571 [Helianthus annuus]